MRCDTHRLNAGSTDQTSNGLEVTARTPTPPISPADHGAVVSRDRGGSPRTPARVWGGGGEAVRRRLLGERPGSGDEVGLNLRELLQRRFQVFNNLSSNDIWRRQVLAVL